MSSESKIKVKIIKITVWQTSKIVSKKIGKIMFENQPEECWKAETVFFLLLYTHYLWMVYSTEFNIRYL